jgi:hypothetical protein
MVKDDGEAGPGEEGAGERDGEVESSRPPPPCCFWTQRKKGSTSSSGVIEIEGDLGGGGALSWMMTLMVRKESEEGESKGEGGC